MPICKSYPSNSNPGLSIVGIIWRQMIDNECVVRFLCFLAGISVVYDSIEASPFYSNTPGDMYLDDKELIEL